MVWRKHNVALRAPLGLSLKVTLQIVMRARIVGVVVVASIMIVGDTDAAAWVELTEVLALYTYSAPRH